MKALYTQPMMKFTHSYKANECPAQESYYKCSVTNQMDKVGRLYKCCNKPLGLKPGRLMMMMMM